VDGRGDEEGEKRPSFAQLHARKGPSTTPVSVRVPDPLLEKIDGVRGEEGFESRSAFVRRVLVAVAEDPDAVDALLSERGRR
jgi:hypothetical protein